MPDLEQPSNRNYKHKFTMCITKIYIKKYTKLNQLNLKVKMHINIVRF